MMAARTEKGPFEITASRSRRETEPIELSEAQGTEKPTAAP
jgi:hypothetical protein